MFRPQLAPIDTEPSPKEQGSRAQAMARARSAVYRDAGESNILKAAIPQVQRPEWMGTDIGHYMIDMCNNYGIVNVRIAFDALYRIRTESIPPQLTSKLEAMIVTSGRLDVNVFSAISLVFEPPPTHQKPIKPIETASERVNAMMQSHRPAPMYTDTDTHRIQQEMKTVQRALHAVVHLLLTGGREMHVGEPEKALCQLVDKYSEKLARLTKQYATACKDVEQSNANERIISALSQLQGLLREYQPDVVHTALVCVHQLHTKGVSNNLLVSLRSKVGECTDDDMGEIKRILEPPNSRTCSQCGVALGSPSNVMNCAALPDKVQYTNPYAGSATLGAQCIRAVMTDAYQNETICQILEDNLPHFYDTCMDAHGVERSIFWWVIQYLYAKEGTAEESRSKEIAQIVHYFHTHYRDHQSGTPPTLQQCSTEQMQQLLWRDEMQHRANDVT